MCISLKDCRHKGLYKIDARNFSLGVYNKKQQGFIGIRTKFNNKFLDLEFHWDTRAPYGTVKPLEYLRQCPIKLLEKEYWEYNKKLYEWLENENKIYKGK